MDYFNKQLKTKVFAEVDGANCCANEKVEYFFGLQSKLNVQEISPLSLAEWKAICI